MKFSMMQCSGPRSTHSTRSASSGEDAKLPLQLSDLLLDGFPAQAPEPQASWAEKKQFNTTLKRKT